MNAPTRWRARVLASRLNELENSVEALLEGEEIDVKKVLDWSERGPSRARVDSVTVERKERLRGLRGFRIVG